MTVYYSKISKGIFWGKKRMISLPVLNRIIKAKVAFQILQSHVLIHPVQAAIELLFLSYSLLVLQKF